jgi:hypothetical protein
MHCQRYDQWKANDHNLARQQSKSLTHRPLPNNKFAAYLAAIYGNSLVVHRGKIHNYLGMDLNFATDKIAQVSMITYT